MTTTTTQSVHCCDFGTGFCAEPATVTVTTARGDRVMERRRTCERHGLLLVGTYRRHLVARDGTTWTTEVSR